MLNTENLVRDFLASGGKVHTGNTRKAIGSKTFRGRYTFTVAGVGRRATWLRDSGLAKGRGSC